VDQPKMELPRKDVKTGGACSSLETCDHKNWHWILGSKSSDGQLSLITRLNDEEDGKCTLAPW